MKGRTERILIIFAFAIFLQNTSLASAQSCRWDGTAPFCGGECGDGETEINRLGSIPDFWEPPFVNSNSNFD